MKKIKDIIKNIFWYIVLIAFFIFVFWAYNWSFDNAPRWYSHLMGYIANPLSFIFVVMLIYLVVSLVTGVVKKRRGRK